MNIKKLKNFVLIFKIREIRGVVSSKKYKNKKLQIIRKTKFKIK